MSQDSDMFGVCIFLDFQMESSVLPKVDFLPAFCTQILTHQESKTHRSFEGKCWSKHVKLNHCAAGLDETSWTVRNFCWMKEINGEKNSMRRDIFVSYINCKSGAKEYFEKVKVVVNIWHLDGRTENVKFSGIWLGALNQTDPMLKGTKWSSVPRTYATPQQYHNNNNTVS